MRNCLQIEHLKKEVNSLQVLHGNPKISAIYGAGQICNPKLLFLFMNPTATNVSANPQWQGLRAPWLGTKNIWKLFYRLGILENSLYENIINNPANWWSEDFSLRLYENLKEKSVYITNLAKCTQDDARPLKNTIFLDYLNNTLHEIELVNPEKIISFGNQVSSILLGKNISVSSYQDEECEILNIKDKRFEVYPTYYPVGQGMRNIDKAIERIKRIM